MDCVVFVSVCGAVSERIVHDERVRVILLRLYVHARHVEARAAVSFARSAGTAEQIQQTRCNKPLDAMTDTPGSVQVAIGHRWRRISHASAFRSANSHACGHFDRQRLGFDYLVVLVRVVPGWLLGILHPSFHFLAGVERDVFDHALILGWVSVAGICPATFVAGDVD